MELKITQKTVYKIDASDLNDFIKYVFGTAYFVEADLEMGDDDIEEIKVTGGLSEGDVDEICRKKIFW